MTAFAVPIPIYAQAAIAALFGLIFGSFITALSYRLPRGISIAHGRSACPSCGATLAVRDLVPVFSWVLHGGRCRACKASISWRYPAIELLMAALFASAVLLVSNPIALALTLAATPVMVALGVIDAENQRLPNGLLAVLAVLALGLRYVTDGAVVVALSAAAIIFASALALDWFARRILGQPGLGMGDAKLMGIVALALPLLPLFIVLTASGFMGVLLAFAFRLRSVRTFPFGPPILAALWVGLVTL